jgi:hypothetical protein
VPPGVPDPRPHVTGWFVEPDEQAKPLFVAMGRAVWGVAALEQHLLLELVRIIWEHDGPDGETAKKIKRLENLTGGQLLRELRGLGGYPRSSTSGSMMRSTVGTCSFTTRWRSPR